MVWLHVRRWVVRPIVWAFALAAFAALAIRAFLASDLARERLARFAESELERIVGRPVSIGTVEYELLPGGFVVRDLLVPGDRPGEPPFLQVREVRVEIDADALRRDLVDIQTISVRGLKARVILRDDGSDNLPDFPKSREGGGRFAVSIGGLYVEDGEIELDERRLPIDVKARAVLVRLAGLGGTGLQGNVTAQEVETRLPAALPWPATISAKIRIGAGEVDILSARIRSAYLDARASGSVGWRGGTHGEIRAQVEMDGRWLDEVGYLEEEIRGPLRFDGALRFARRDLAIDGHLATTSASLFGFEVEELGGHVEGDSKRIVFDIEQGGYRGGALDGRFAVDLAAEPERGRLELEAENLPAELLLEDLDLPAFRAAATASGTLVLDFPLREPKVGSGSAALELAAAARDGAVPVDGIVKVALAGGTIELREIALATPFSRIDGEGEVGLDGDGRFVLRIASDDLGEVARLQPFVPLEPWPIWLPGSGRGELEAVVRLGGGDVDAAFSLDLAEVRTPGLASDRVSGALAVDAVAVRDLDLELARGDARLVVAGVFPLEEGGTAADLALAFEGWPVEEAKVWVPLPLALAGPAYGTLALSGPLEALSGDLVTYVSPIAVGDVAAERLDLALTWDERQVTVARATLTSAAGVVAGSGTYGFLDGALDFEIATGEAGLELAQLPFSGVDSLADRSDRSDPSDTGLAGTLRLTARVGGTAKAPAATLEGEVERFALVGRDLSGEGPTRVAATLGGGELGVELSLPGLLELRGGGGFAPGESAALDFELETARLDRWIAVAAGEHVPELSGALAGRIEIRQGPGTPLAGRAILDRLDLARRGRTLALIEPARLGFDAREARIESLYLGDPSRQDDLFVAGTIGFAETAGLDLKVQAAASIDWIEDLAGLDFDGRFELLSTVRGTLEQPAWNGEAALREARLIPPRLPHTLDRLEALVLFYPEAIVLDQARADFAGGRVTAFGRLDLPQAGRSLDYRFQTLVENAALRYPDGFLLKGDAELTLQSTAEGRQIRGEIDLARLDYVQDINLSPTQLVQRFLTRTRLQVEETDDLLSSTYLSLAVEAPGSLRVRNNLARLDGNVDLAVRGTLANPVLFGEVTIRPGGTIEYAGNSYDVERGVLTFVNPSRIVPIVDIVTRTRIDDYQVQLTIGGSLDRLATNFSSNPPLSEYDVLALLATGSTAGEDAFSGTGGGDTGSAALAAESLLYGQAAALIGARVGTLFGVDRLKIDPLTTGDTVSAARVTVGKRLSRKVYVTYSVDPSSTAQQILEVEWKISDDLTLVLTQNGDGSYALDTRWGRRF